MSEDGETGFELINATFPRGEDIAVLWHKATPAVEGDWIGLHFEDTGEDEITAAYMCTPPVGETGGIVQITGDDLPTIESNYVFRYHSAEEGVLATSEAITVGNDDSNESEAPTPRPQRMNFNGADDYISDVVVVCRTKGEEAPEGYIEIERDMNGGNDGKMYVLAFKPAKKGSGEPPLTMFGVSLTREDADEPPPEGCVKIEETVGERKAELNDGNGSAEIYLYKGWVENGKAPIRDITVLNFEKDDPITPGYVRVQYTAGPSVRDADLNGGTTGDDVYASFIRAGDPVLRAGGVLGLQGSNGLWLSIGNKGAVAAEAMRSHECLLVEEQHGRVALRGLQGGYLSVQPSGEVTVSDKAGENELFEVGVCAGYVMLRTGAGKFLRMPGDPLEGEDAEELPRFRVLGCISDIAVSTTKKQRLSLVKDRFVSLNQDLNKDAGGSFVQLWYRRGYGPAPITDIDMINLSWVNEPQEEEEGEGATPAEPPKPESEDEAPRSDFVAFDRNGGASDKGKGAASQTPWTLVEQNLNDGVEDADILNLQYKRRPLITSTGRMVVPFTYVKVISGRTTKPATGFTKLDKDLNESAGGAYVFVTYMRGMMSELEKARIKAEEEAAALALAQAMKEAREKKERDLTALQIEQVAYARRDDPSEWTLLPLPLQAPVAMLAMENAGNTCYLDSTVFGMFACTRAYDSLLLPTERLPADLEEGKALYLAATRHYLREAVVNPVRRGELVPWEVMDGVRYLMRMAGWENFEEVDLFGPTNAQQDASELLMFLFDRLNGNYLMYEQQFSYQGILDPSSEPSREIQRTIQVSLPEEKKKKKEKKPSHRSARSRAKKRLEEEKADRLATISLEQLVKANFLDNPLEGFKRDICPALQALIAERDAKSPLDGVRAATSTATPPGTPTSAAAEVPPSPAAPPPDWGREIRLAWGHFTEKMERCGVVIPAARPVSSSFPENDIPGLLVPIHIKRFNNDMEKVSTRVHIPEFLDMRRFMSPNGGEGRSAVMRLRSVVCHSGKKVDAGHYYAYSRRDEMQPGADGAPTIVSTWLRMDDMDYEDGPRVKPCTVMDSREAEDGLDLDLDYKSVVREAVVCFYELGVSPQQAQ